MINFINDSIFLIFFIFRAEKKFKKILKKLDEPDDHLKFVKGQPQCHICGLNDFQSEEDALDHIKKEHNSDGDGDFEASDSDASVINDESTETEGSSGVEEDDDEFSKEDDELSGNDDSYQNVSSQKAKPSATEPQEVKNGRAILTESVESFHGVSIATKTIKWTQQL